MRFMYLAPFSCAKRVSVSKNCQIETVIVRFMARIKPNPSVSRVIASRTTKSKMIGRQKPKAGAPPALSSSKRRKLVRLYLFTNLSGRHMSSARLRREGISVSLKLLNARLVTELIRKRTVQNTLHSLLRTRCDRLRPKTLNLRRQRASQLSACIGEYAVKQPRRTSIDLGKRSLPSVETATCNKDEMSQISRPPGHASGPITERIWNEIYSLNRSSAQHNTAFISEAEGRCPLCVRRFEALNGFSEFRRQRPPDIMYSSDLQYQQNDQYSPGQYGLAFEDPTLSMIPEFDEILEAVAPSEDYKNISE